MSIYPPNIFPVLTYNIKLHIFRNASIDMLSPQKYQGEWEAEGVQCQLVGEGEIVHQPADKKILILTR